MGWTETQLGSRPSVLVLSKTRTRANDESKTYFKVKNVNKIVENKSTFLQIITHKLVFSVHYGISMSLLFILHLNRQCFSVNRNLPVIYADRSYPQAPTTPQGNNNSNNIDKPLEPRV